MFGFGRSTLYRQVYSDAVLTTAWQKVKGGSEAAGVDDVTVEQFDKRLFANLKALQEELRCGRYYPQPVKRIYLHKPDGSRRPLGILTVRDRLAQRAVLEVIDPIFDQHFEECSHGFRKGRSIYTALDQVKRLVQHQHAWLVDLDIASYFERINTQRLFKFVRQQIRERELQRLLHAWLTIETVVVERTGVRRKEEARGLLQGGVISPLLANVYLDRFDKLALRQGLKLVRYGDDIVVCCCSKKEAEAALKLLEKLLAKLDLTVNPRKTVIVHAEKGFDYLGERLFLKTTEAGKQHVASWRPKVPERPVPALPLTTTTLSDHTEESDVAQRHSEP